MSLLPRIPCIKLFIDSRYALPGGSATEFEVEIPQGGLDLPDNCVGFIDAISVPSFPNVFEGRDRIYIREDPYAPLRQARRKQLQRERP